ncbi:MULTISPECIES: YciI family protein [unclassified Streptomyces]|uniref:YciI family protein n=1 Tax=unclassified Streptomyces TaxID=2593676 RepID=UPI00038203F9|nr:MULTISPECIES: YciI family protein [unclassified Streptomyces]MYT33082.1 GTP cyclohydrolase [Streptomyces sp. SID8354]
MYAIHLTYHVPLDEIDALRAEHLKHVDRNIEEGVYLFGGPFVPRTGGFIVAGDVERSRIVDALDVDPFVRSGAATYEIHEFKISRANEEIQPALGVSLS